MTNIVELLQSLVVTYGLNVLWAIVIFIIGRWAAGLASRLVKRVLTKADVDKSLINFVGQLVYIGILVFAIIAVFERLGVETTSFIAVLGAAGLAIGLALQGALGNFAAGVMILLFKPFKVGDKVEVADIVGNVERIQIFNTILVTPDKRTVIIPNGQVTGNPIINYSTKGVIRIDMVFGIGYEDDLLKAKQILEEIVNNHELVVKDPPPTVGVSELADSSVNFAVLPHVKVNDYWDAYFDLTEKIKLRFDQEGISIPYPQQDVHMHQVNSNGAS